MAETPHIYTDYVYDDDGVPVSGALIYIRDENGALITLPNGDSNPKVTDSAGFWTTGLMGGIYFFTIVSGCSEVTTEVEVCADADVTLIRGGIIVGQYNFIQTPDYRQPTHIYTPATFLEAITELSVAIGLRASTRIFTTCTIA